MSLVDEDSGLMDRLGLEALLIDSGLQSLIEELIDGETEDVIEFEFLVGEEAISMHSVKKCRSFEKSSFVLFFKGQQLSGCLSEFGQDQMNSPDLSLVL